MVSLDAIRESNALIASSLPSRLVAVFVGATSGIGETTLRNFIKKTSQPRVYFLGRREAKGNRIQEELNKINPGGKYYFLKCDASLLKNVDDACRYIQNRELAINLLFLSSGTLVTGKTTEEGLHYPFAVAYYCRTRFIVNLLPQLRQASKLRRVITVLAGGKEGKIFTEDFQGYNVGFTTGRGHITSMVTLVLNHIAKQAPEVSFIQAYPGFVKTDLGRDLTGIGAAINMFLLKPVVAIMQVPIEETGERHTYLATTARFPPADGKDAEGVALGKGADVAVGVDGKVGGGVYSVDYEAEGTIPRVQELIQSFVKDGTAEKTWKYTKEEYILITGTVSL